MFWIAIDESNSVIGMIGTKTFTKNIVWLKRLYIKPNMKRKGIGSALLKTVEDYAKAKGINKLHTRFNDQYNEAYKFYTARGFKESIKRDGLKHFIKSL